MLVVRRKDEGGMYLSGVCVSVLSVRTRNGKIEKYIWAGSWASDPMEIEGISCSVCRLHSKPPSTISAVVYLCTWPWVYPNPLLLLFSPLSVSYPPTPSLFSPSIIPSHHPSVCFCLLKSPAVFLVFTPLILLVCLLPPNHLFSFRFSVSFLFSVPPFTPQGRHVGLMNMESPEQISLLIRRCILCSAPLIVSRKQSVY